MFGNKTIMELRRYASGQTGSGGGKKTYRGIATHKGVLVAKSGSDRIQTDKQTVFTTHIFVITKPMDITMSNKDRYYNLNTGKEYKIIYINNNQNVTLEINLQEIL